MYKKFNLEQRLVYSLLFELDRETYELVLSNFVPVEERDLFVQYILDVLDAGSVKVLSDQLVMDYKLGTVWKLNVSR